MHSLSIKKKLYRIQRCILKKYIAGRGRRLNKCEKKTKLDICFFTLKLQVFENRSITTSPTVLYFVCKTVCSTSYNTTDRSMYII